MIESTNGMSAADVAAVVGNNRNNNDGIFGGEGGYLLLFLVLLMSGGLWGGNGMFGGMGGGAMWNMGMAPYFYSSQTQNEVSRGFDNSAVNTALAAISAAVNGIAHSVTHCHSQQAPPVGRLLQGHCVSSFTKNCFLLLYRYPK